MRARDAYIQQRLEATDGNHQDPYILSMKALPEDLATVTGKVMSASLSAIKSLPMFNIVRAHLTRIGLQEESGSWADRSLMLALPSDTPGVDYKRLSQREAPQLSQLGQYIDQYRRLRIKMPGQHPLKLADRKFANPHANLVTVEAVPGKIMHAQVVEDETGVGEDKITEEIREFLAQFRADTEKIVLLCSTETPQIVDERGQPHDHNMYFTDGGQLLVTNQTSHEFIDNALVQMGKKPMSPSAWRSNLLLELPAHIEDVATGIRINDAIDISFGNPCIRCSVIANDQVTGVVREKSEPLSELLAIRPIRLDGSSKRPTFGTNAQAVFSGNDWSYSLDLRDGRQPHVQVLGEKEI